MAKGDDRFHIIKPSVAIKPMLEKEGYPFKSKLHSKNLSTYQRLGKTKTITDYLGETGNNTKFRCPKTLQYQFTEANHLKVANMCCQRLKKDPVKKWERENNRFLAVTGMRKEEGGTRGNSGCILTDKNGKAKKFNPLIVVTEEWENWFIEQNHIELCELYYPPFNFKRTGCKGCPFSLDLQEQLTLMQTYMPKERKQCEIIWKPVYEEYRRIHYRLDDEEQLKLF